MSRRAKPERLCKRQDCNVRFVPKFPRQEYHAVECREIVQRRRDDERKTERALELAQDPDNGKRHKLPSVFLEAGTTREAKVLMDIRFELEADEHQGTPTIFAGRVKGVLEAGHHGTKDLLYGSLVLLASCCARWAITLDAAISRRRSPDVSAATRKVAP